MNTENDMNLEFVEELSPNKKYFVNENEEVLEYDVCADTNDYYNPKYFSLIGRGVVCMIVGVPQEFSWDNPDHVLYFYKNIRKVSVLE